MPTTINGIGTAYIGRRNVHSRLGTCSGCGQTGMLDSYRTRKFFTFIYLPLIPLGEVQVSAECPACRRHVAARGAEWDLATGRDVSSAMAAVEAEPSAWQGYADLVAALSVAGRSGEAADTAKQLERDFGDQAGVQFFLGAWREMSGENSKSHRHFREAFRLAPQEWAHRRAAAMCELECGEPAAAEKLLAGVTPQSPEWEPGLFLRLAELYQQKGASQDAQRVLAVAIEGAPGIETNKAVRKLVKQVARSTGDTAIPLPRIPFWKSPIFRWCAAAALLLAVLGGVNHYIEQHRDVYFVNGYFQPLKAVVDGEQEMVVAAQGYVRVSLPEGPHTVTVLEPRTLSEQPFTVSAGYFSRFFSRPAFVVDPGRSAVVVLETATYGGPSATPVQPRLHVGQLYAHHSNVDFLFEEFPDEIQAKGHSVHKRTRVMLQPLDATQIATLALTRETESQEWVDLVESHIMAASSAALEGKDKLLLYAYLSLADRLKQGDRCLALLRTRLPDRPLLVEWHRAYQALRSKDASDEPELLEEYDAILARSPDDPAALYLRGRIDDDAIRMGEYFRRACERKPGFSRALLALGDSQAQRGDFDAALASAAQAYHNARGDYEYARQLHEAHFAAGKMDLLVQQLEQEWSSDPENANLVETLLEAYERQGDAAAGDRVLEKYSLAATKQDQENAGDLLLHMKLHRHYFRGEIDRLGELAPRLADGRLRQHWLTIAAVEQGNIGRLDLVDLNGSNTDESLRGFLRYIEYAIQGNQEQAAEALEATLKGLRAGPRRLQRWAELFAKDALAEGDVDRLVTSNARERSVLWLALAAKHPSARAELLPRVERQNYSLDFPHHLIVRQIKDLQRLSAAVK